MAFNQPEDRVEIGGRSVDPSSSNSARPFISVHFACCGVYQRIYRSSDGTSYNGHCPKCAKPVRFKVGPGGTDCRSFVVH
jgi:hypothetical protein